MSSRLDLASPLMAIALGTLVGAQFLAVDVGKYFYFAGGAISLICLVALFRRPSTQLKNSLGPLALCVAPLFTSLLINGANIEEIYPPVVLSAFALAAFSYGLSASESEWIVVLRRATIVALALFVCASFVYRWDFISPLRFGGRIATGMHPNLFGLTAMSLFLLSSSSRRTLFVTSLFCVSLFACLAASSRASMMTVIGVFLISRLLLWRRQLLLLAGGLVSLLFSGTLALALAGDKLGGVADAVFHINDHYRGFDTGGSGRIQLWSYFLKTWEQHPFFGPGPGTFYEMEGRSIYSHNLVLQLLTDSGLVGLICFGVFVISVLRAAFRPGVPETTRNMCLLSVICYFLYGLFEGRAINIGNPLSCVFFFITFATLGAAGSRRQGQAINNQFNPKEKAVAPKLSDVRLLRVTQNL